MKVSLIVPCFNEAQSVHAFHDAVRSAFSGSPYDYEILYIDDGSTDATLHNLKEIYAQKDAKVKIISFSKNFGKEAGIFAGLEHAGGDYLSVIDADLQQQPSLVVQMVDILEANSQYDIVAAYQESRDESKILSFFKRGFYRAINILSETKLRHDASDFRTFRRSVAESILKMREYHRFSKGIFAWIGYSTCYIPYTADKRVAGQSKWTFRSLTKYAISGIVGYSAKPLHIATLLGLISAAASFIYLIVVVLQKLIRGIPVPGYATIIVLILFLGGMQLFCLGIIGGYIGRIFEQSKNRPIYIAKEIIGEDF